MIFAINRAILLTESVLDILLYPQSTIKPTMVGLEKIFQNGGSQITRNGILRLVFANTVNASFN